jgi:uncharacterized protein
MSDEVRHNAEMSRYELEADGGVTYAEYHREGDTLFINHTVTPPAQRGQGLAGRLMKGLFADVRRQGLKIVPQCSYVVTYLKRYPEERDVVVEG